MDAIRGAKMAWTKEEKASCWMLVAAAVVILLVLGYYVFGGNSWSRRWGGTSTVDLPPGRKLVIATWKDESLWTLTRPMRDGELAEEYEFSERANLGVMEGKVVIKEKMPK
jgi:hypothetical protein